MFKFVTEPPDIGIRVEWETSTTADYRLQEFMPDGLHPKSARIRISSTRYPTYQGIRTVMMHEFGHAHRWGHAINSRYLLTGGATSNTVSDPTDDERRAFLLMLALPDRIDLSRYHIDDF